MTDRTTDDRTMTERDRRQATRELFLRHMVGDTARPTADAAAGAETAPRPIHGGRRRRTRHRRDRIGGPS